MRWLAHTGLALAGAALGVLIYVFSGARPQTPNLELFLSGKAPAWSSPPLLARLRSGPRIAALATESVD